MNDISLLHIALIYLAVIRSSFARLLPKGRKNEVESEEVQVAHKRDGIIGLGCFRRKCWGMARNESLAS